MESRVASCSRVTKETQIEMTLNLDGTGKTDISTGIGFFDHMLSGFARHGLFDLTVKVTGDLEVDSHHTIEDTGIVLGQTIAKALGDKKGIKRYGHFMLPMDEVLVLSAIDLSGRPYLNFDATFTCDKLGELDTEMVKEFFYAVSYSGGNAALGSRREHIQVIAVGPILRSIGIFGSVVGNPALHTVDMMADTF